MMLNGKLDFHPAANGFPLMKSEELQGLIEDMRERGFDEKHPILLCDKMILDGRNRYRASQEAEVAPIFAEWHGIDPWEFVWNENGNRRDIAQGTRACCYLWNDWKGIQQQNIERQEAANRKRSKAAKRQPRTRGSSGRIVFSGPVSRDTGPQTEDRARTDLAAKAGVGEATMGRALLLAYSGEAGWELFRQVVQEGLELNEALRQLRGEQIDEKPLPSGQYRIVYADPPWDYGDKRSGIGEGLHYGPATGHYPSMPLAKLKELKVVEMSAPDSVLFLWATSPLLPDALELIVAWGFTYKASFIWWKVRHNFGHYNSVRHELLLIATRGSCLPDINAKLEPSVIKLERSKEHSEKPVEFREMIDRMYSPPKEQIDRIEMFARGEVPKHWMRWGAEVGGQNAETVVQ